MGTVELVIAPRRRSIGDGEVDRLLPYRERRMLGPFVYTDLIGPDRLPPGEGVDVPVHPHIGLATVTFLFEGALVHRDSTGAVQRIEPGGVNWMTAGRGVAHSERSPDDERAADSTIEGLQTWVALPADAEEVDPSFEHVPADRVPRFAVGDASVRLVAGTFASHHAPVGVASPLFHCAIDLEGAGTTTIDEEHRERGVIVRSGSVSVEGRELPPRHLVVFEPGGSIELRSTGPASLVAFGGARLGDRSIMWNFVSSSRDRIDRAAAAWRAGDWPGVPGDDERVPMPR